MKPLSIIAFFFAAFLIFVGIVSRKSSGGLSYAVMIAGGLILTFLTVVWLIVLTKQKKEKTIGKIWTSQNNNPRFDLNLA